MGPLVSGNVSSSNTESSESFSHFSEAMTTFQEKHPQLKHIFLGGNQPPIVPIYLESEVGLLKAVQPKHPPEKPAAPTPTMHPEVKGSNDSSHSKEWNWFWAEGYVWADGAKYWAEGWRCPTAGTAAPDGAHEDVLADHSHGVEQEVPPSQRRKIDTAAAPETNQAGARSHGVEQEVHSSITSDVVTPKQTSLVPGSRGGFDSPAPAAPPASACAADAAAGSHRVLIPELVMCYWEKAQNRMGECQLRAVSKIAMLGKTGPKYRAVCAACLEWTLEEPIADHLTDEHFTNNNWDQQILVQRALICGIKSKSLLVDVTKLKQQ